MSEPLYGAVEAGGTKFVCLVGRDPHDVVARLRIPTTDPPETLAAVGEFFDPWSGRLTATGVATFGPAEVRPDHPSWGFITTTPKPGWSDIDIAGHVARATDSPVGFHTDVTGAALAEARWGASRSATVSIYLTLGTGIGAAVIVSGAPLPGLGHAEMGHVALPRLTGDDFAGVCPYHGDCLEGMVSGPALAARFATEPPDLQADQQEDAMRIVAGYVALAVRGFVYTLAPDIVVIGGGVAELPGLLATVRAQLRETLAGYPGLPEHAAEEFVVAPALGSEAGAYGGFVLAEHAANGAI